MYTLSYFKATRVNSKMMPSQKWHFLDSLCPLITICHYFCLPPRNPKSNKAFYRKANYKYFLQLNIMLHITNLIVNRWLK